MLQFVVDDVWPGHSLSTASLPAGGIEIGAAPGDTEGSARGRGTGTVSLHPAVTRRGPAATGLPAEPTQARRFVKTRSALSTALLEDYAELIADLLASDGEARPTDIARRLGVSHATAIKTIARLKREGLATARPYRGVFLTEAGERLAARVKARHRVVVELLLAVGVPPEAAEQDAEGIEHHVSPETLAAFKAGVHGAKS